MWPIAHLLHIAPWDQRDRLTVSELMQACAFVDQWNKASRGK